VNSLLIVFVTNDGNLGINLVLDYFLEILQQQMFPDPSFYMLGDAAEFSSEFKTERKSNRTRFIAGFVFPQNLVVVLRACPSVGNTNCNTIMIGN